MADPGGTDAFVEYRRLFLAELEHNREAVKDLGQKFETGMDQINRRFDALHHGDISRIKVDIAMLQVRCGLYGAATGALVAGMVEWLRGH